ncbi:MAG: phosphohistidine phosphatase [Ectothiorhodospiraceae bacterium]|nr:phosphohistidine phosphatase [Ectothiorhodospiraceae bacterium]
MKKLIIARHAKSSWSDAALTDFERPLNKRGRRDAPFMGKLLAKQQIVPECIVSSPANRALTTARILAENMDFPLDHIRVEEELYESGLKDYVRAIHSIDCDVNTVMIVGHNPTITMFAEHLSDHDFENIPTCGIVILQFDMGSWSEIEQHTGEVLSFEFPKKYFT